MNSPYGRGTLAQSVQVMSISLTPRVIRALERYRTSVLAEHNVKMSRNDVIERALLDFYAAKGIKVE